MKVRDATEALDVRSAGALIGLGPKASYRAAARGEIPAVFCAGRWIVPLHAWRRFLAGDWHRDTNGNSSREDAAG